MKKTSALRLAFMASTAAALAVAGPAYAQEGAEQEAAENDEGVIIVTAQRRDQNLQDVPIQVSYADSEFLSSNNIDDGSRLNVVTPSLALRATDDPSSGVRLLIRGIGIVGPSATTEGGVGVFVDGVYRSRNGSVLSNFLDFENVQVLKGPQGTLFGKNTTAGAIVLTSTKADLSEAEGKYEIRLGKYDERVLKGSVSIPLAEDQMAVRLSMMGFNKGGFVDNILTGEKENQKDGWAGKVALRFEPTDEVRFNLVGDWSETGGNCCGAVSYSFIGSPLTGLVFGPLSAPYGVADTSREFIDNREFVVSSNNRLDTSTRDRGVSLNTEIDVGPGTLTSITAYREWRTRLNNASSFFSPADILRNNVRFDTEQFSQELLYDVDINDRVNALFGVYYSNEDVVRERDLINGVDAPAFWGFVAPGDASPGLFQSEHMEANAKSLSFFTHWSAEIAENLTAVAGIRYSRENKQASYVNLVNPPAGSVWTVVNAFPGPAFNDRYKTDAFSGTASLSYKFSSDATVFAKFSRGFKSGGVIIDANAAGTPADVGAPLDTTYGSEFVNSYEVGGKFRFLDGKGSANLSFFYNDISDLQVPQFLGVAFTILNAKSAKNYGAELETTYRFNDVLSMSLNGTWIPHAKYGVDPAIEGTSAGRAVSGERFLLTPNLALSGSLNLDQPVSENIAFTASTGFQYSSKQRTNSGALPIANPNGYVANQQREMILVDASVGIKDIDGLWNLSAYCNNCTDKRYLQAEFGAVFQTGSYMGFAAQPRTFGVSLRGAF